MKSDHVSRGGSGAGTRARGFTLIEVMVALIITSIGLLGIAKLQALAYASTGSASMRSLVALQVAGLAASMHADRTYWAGGYAPSPITITGTAVSPALSASAVTSTNCAFGSASISCYCVFGSGSTPCTTPSATAAGADPTLAAFDVSTYATALNGMLGNSSPVTTITCTKNATTATVSCEIQATWNEKAVSIDAQSRTNTLQTTFAPTYTLYVEP
jgi:type IV pilus assembly protein PilV